MPGDRLEESLGLLAGYGFRVARSAVERHEVHFLAGSDAERLQDFTNAFRMPGVSAVMASRGGHGCLRLLPELDWNSLPKEKPLVGFSDLTALHLSRLSRTGLGGWHAPVASGLARLGPQARDESMADLMGRGKKKWAFQPVEDGLARGPLVGGNLTLLNALLGTVHLPSLDGAILMLEDVGERGYRLDRHLSVLGLSGRLAGLAGCVFGDFSDCGDQELVDWIIGSFASRCLPGVPVARGAPFGHGRRNLPWWYGEVAELEVWHGAAELRFLER
jgi:muramoyltetrapeptide carboxypeptidase